MKRKKILAISIVCVLLVGGGSVGGAAYYKKSKNEKRVVNVTPVVNMMGYDYGSEKTIDGTVITGSKQNVMLEKNQVVQSVLVKKGDKVKVGTPLIAYDTTALKLAVQEKKNAVDAAEDDLRQARKELERLQSLHPAEDQVRHDR
ncbi:MAG: biotin/lipoyl-binding protein [Ruminococcus sp.]